MKILLLNDNPVVNKLVTLSAQKTSDELEIVEGADAISENSYDLLVIDDTIYSDELMSEVHERITFTKSLYICSRDAENTDIFTTIIKKPFLPTDLVELFSSLGKELEVEEPIDDAVNDEVISLDEPNLEDLDEELELDLDLDDDLDIEDDLSLDEIELEDDDLGLEDDLSLDLEEDLSLDDLENDISQEDATLNVLDKDELQEVQDLLDDEVEEELELDEVEDSVEDDSVEEELELDEVEDSVEDDSVEEELELEEVEGLDLEEELELEDVEDVDEVILEEELAIEDQIQNAVSELSQDDLESEVDEDTLLDIAAIEISDMDSLTSRDLKLAIGEEVDEILELDEEHIDDISEVKLNQTVDMKSDNDGIESLKKLLKALTNEDVAASMKGMKISINIELGDS